MDIPAIKARHSAATPGPWEFTDGFYGWDSGIFPVGCEDKLNQSIFANNGHGNGDPTQADAEFIAHARTDIPQLVQALEEAQDVVKDAGCDEKFARADGKPCGECIACRIRAILGESQ